MKIKVSCRLECRAQPDWAHEFPDRTGWHPNLPDLYSWKFHLPQVWVINSHKIRSLDKNWCQKKIDNNKKILENNLEIFWFFDFFFQIFCIIIVLIKVWGSGRKTSGFRTARTLKICRTSELDVMSGRALLEWTYKVRTFGLCSL